jgi:hypothetical protein
VSLFLAICRATAAGQALPPPLPAASESAAPSSALPTAGAAAGAAARAGAPRAEPESDRLARARGRLLRCAVFSKSVRKEADAAARLARAVNALKTAAERAAALDEKQAARDKREIALALGAVVRAIERNAAREAADARARRFVEGAARR